ncbi:hypothetical protein GCM10023093_24430 [Nemorincola caseinilytica]|uniref:Uncharacterized protein n=1 Tax=Nemorincola caseinilytica TaxID=2054315 RepID=A0ABP8NLN4_9BACT
MLVAGTLRGQQTFKAGWKTYTAGSIIHEYIYNYTHADSVRLSLADSIITYIATDSSVTMTEAVRGRDNNVYKTINYFSPKRQLLKTEDYKDGNLLEANEWRYDDKNRKICHIRTNALNSNVYKKTYDYSADKKTGESVTSECSYFNGKIEFYTKMYYDKEGQKIKEVRMNDNNKDVIHVENYTYGENGKVKERSVYFPEFKITKKFDEPAGNVPSKCYGIKPVGTAERVHPASKVPYITRVIARNKAMLQDPGCREFEYTFTNNVNCVITIATTKVNNGRTVRYRFKEKV